MMKTVANDPKTTFDGAPGLWEVIGYLIMIILVLAIIIGLIVFLIKFLAKRNSAWASGKSIRLLGGVMIGQNKSVQVVKIGDVVYIVGVGDDVRLIDKVESTDAVESVLESMKTPQMAPMKAWVPLVREWWQRRRGQQSNAQHFEMEQVDAVQAETFEEIFHSKMRQVTNRKQLLDQMLTDYDEPDEGNR